MKHKFLILILIVSSVEFSACKKKSTDPPVVVPPKQMTVTSVELNNAAWGNTVYGVNRQPVIRVKFSEPVKQSTVAAALKLTDANAVEAAVTVTFQNNDSVLLIQQSVQLPALALYQFIIAGTLGLIMNWKFFTNRFMLDQSRGTFHSRVNF